MLADVHPVQDQGDEVEPVQRRRLPGAQLRRRLRHEAAADTALARTAADHAIRYRLQAPRILARGHAHQHLLDDATIQRVLVGQRLEGRQRHLAPAARTRGRATVTFRPPSTTSLGAVPAREAVRAA